MGQQTNSVEVLAMAAGAIGEWRGIVTVGGLPEFRTERTYESKDAAYRAAQKLLCQAYALVAENAAALGAEIQSIAEEMAIDCDIEGKSWGWRYACDHYSGLLNAALARANGGAS